MAALPKEVPVDRTLQAWGAPERVVLVSSADAEGRANLIAVGWAMRASMEPGVFAIGLGQKSHSCANITAAREFVLCIPGADLAEPVLYCGRHSGREVDKFAETGLTAAPARQVSAPLVAECLANYECRVIATQDIGDHRVFFGEVAASWETERAESRPLIITGEGTGYEVLHADDIFRLGAVRA